jgi:hypothetical protein
MTFLHVITALRDCDVRLSLRAGSVVVNAPVGVLGPELRDQLARHRSLLLRVLGSGDPGAWPAWLVEDCEERAAIREYLGCAPRLEAEQLAVADAWEALERVSLQEGGHVLRLVPIEEEPLVVTMAALLEVEDSRAWPGHDRATGRRRVTNTSALLAEGWHNDQGLHACGGCGESTAWVNPEGAALHPRCEVAEREWGRSDGETKPVAGHGRGDHAQS